MREMVSKNVGEFSFRLTAVPSRETFLCTRNNYHLQMLARFELRGPHMACFDKEGGKLKGDIHLAGAIAVQDSTADDAKAFELEIKMSDRVYRLNCPDPDERKEWIAALLGAQETVQVALGAAESESNPVAAPAESTTAAEPELAQSPSADPQSDDQDGAEEGVPPEQQGGEDGAEVAVGTEIDDQVAI